MRLNGRELALRAVSDVLLFSGGLDSYILWHLLGFPTAVYVKLGHKYQAQELETLSNLRATHAGALTIYTLDGPQIGRTEEADGHIPHRNLHLMTTVSSWLHPKRIYYGALLGETSRDKTGKFIRMTGRLLSYDEGMRVRIVAPARRWTKTGLVRRYLKRMNGDDRLLHQTRSCYEPGEVACGKCVACFRRWVAFANNGIYADWQHAPWEMEYRIESRYLLQNPIREWPGILANQLDALRALHNVERYIEGM